MSAVERVAQFVDMWTGNPYSHRGERIYGLAESNVETDLTVSDLREVIRLARLIERNGP